MVCFALCKVDLPYLLRASMKTDVSTIGRLAFHVTEMWTLLVTRSIQNAVCSQATH